MTDQSQEPTMEEILASIRRIISEDDQPAETAAPAPAPVAPEPVAAAPFPAVEPAPAPEPEPVYEEIEDDVLELTDTYEAPAYEAPAVETLGDLDIGGADPAPAYAAPEPAPSYDSLVGESAAASAASAFAGLHASLNKTPTAAPATADLPFVSGNTVEAMVAEMLRPMLKSWLDANLPGIVEEAVRKEVERISRSV
jgi:hypothetical protein